MAAEVNEAEEVVGATLAHAAAFTGDTRALVALSGQDPELLRAKTEDGETPAHHAAAAGVVASLECLGAIDVTLLAEADVEGWCVGLWLVCATLCLLYACARLTDDMAFSVLLFIRTPAHTAAFYGQLEALQVSTQAKCIDDKIGLCSLWGTVHGSGTRSHLRISGHLVEIAQRPANVGHDRERFGESNVPGM